MAEVQLVAMTQPIESVTGCKTASEFIAYAARVSNPTNQHNNDTADRLVSYLIKNKHWSPFEMVHLTIEIETTRDIARQILRHRSFAFQEFSQRYAVATGFQTREARMQDNKNRQNSLETDDEELKTLWLEAQNNMIKYAQDVYDWALEHGIAKEQARAVLPEGLTTSKMYVSGTLRSWIHYCQIRCEEGTQKEHRDIANKVAAIIEDQFPTLKDQLGND
jgi:thymidylate synthase (FAD)